MRRDFTLKSKLFIGLQLLANLGCIPSDSDEERLKKATLAFASIACQIIGYLWGLIYWVFGFTLAGLIPFGYAIISLISLFFFIKYKNFKFFRVSQLTLILLLPFLLQWSLGGVKGSGAVMVFSVLSPLGAMVFSGIRSSVIWLGLFMLLLVTSVLSDLYFPHPINLPPFFSELSFIFNIGTMVLLMYIMLQYFIKGMERADSAQRCFCLTSYRPRLLPA
jgi:adenylate cyclase